MEKLFETGRIVQEAVGRGQEPPKSVLGWALRFLRFLFNLALVSSSSRSRCLGALPFVIYTYDDQLDSSTRTRSELLGLRSGWQPE